MENRHLKLLVIAHTNRGPGASGVGVNLLRAMNSIDRKLEIVPVLPAGCGYENVVKTCSLPAIWFDQRGSYIRRLFFDRITLPQKIRREKPDVILALGNIGILNPPVPQAVLVQDAHYVYPRRHYGPMTAVQHLRYVIQKQQVRYCLKRTSILYCQTATMLKHLFETFGNHPHVRILSKGISTTVVENSEKTDMPQEFEAFKEHFRMICLTRYNPHKNLEIILKTFMDNRDLLRDVVVFITITAGQHPNAKRLLNKIHRYGLSDHIVNLGPVEQHRIPGYFKNCHALFFPTLMESFSATYLEAMQFDLPILTSDLDFAHEICGPAAFYLDPWSTQSMADAIVRIREDAELRAHLAQAGRNRLATVLNRSWNDIAGMIVSDLRNLVSNSEI